MRKVIITKDNLEEIIAKQCDGLTDQFEDQALNEWISISDENKHTYQKVVQTNGYYKHMNANPVDVDLAWKKVSSKMKKPEFSQDLDIKPNRSVKRILKMVGYAATVGVLIAVGILMRSTNSTSQYITTDTAIAHELQDGSVIHLGKNSALSKLAENDREYNFSGEAEFQIKHDDNSPFIVHMSNIKVKDLGTVFFIKSIPSNDTVFVKVTEGIAQFYTLDNIGIILENGEEGMYIKSKNKFYKRTIDSENQFLSITFTNTTLGEILDHLAYSFRKDVSIKNEALKNCNLTVEFSRAPLSMVKEIIGETLNVNIIDDHTSLAIEGKGCDK